MNSKYKKGYLLFTVLIMALILVVPGCAKSNEKKQVIIADQFGLAYAPLEIMRHEGFLENALTSANVDLEVVWKKLPNTAAMREAMIANELDFGFVGIPPFLIGKDKGMDWRIVMGLSESPLGLVAPADMESLLALKSDQKILLPQPGSIQHILLSMYAEKISGDAKAFDDQLVSMSHPDGQMVMMNNDSRYLHFTSPPYLDQELKQTGLKVLVDGETCFGDSFTFIVGICPERVYEDTALYNAFSSALSKSIDFMNDKPDRAYEILLENYTEADLGALSDMTYTHEVKGLERFLTFMSQQKMIESNFEQEDLIWQ
ncbi:ABC transporter substrate-binding protein [Fusibacter sp. 3D3]|uniref:ABC transporter substrate-binding protein n=1 Tax=Fusibacter sp. 3D3 TaxID=1048380 RepID=UPI000856606D|nr:ABC transporter substrate-binding protein [Fusibacter sp. 3D3]GAU78285.1 ABC-type nitrate/sulfonate/bicarbonate transport systems [Fusibacter sp. 3D3]